MKKILASVALIVSLIFPSVSMAVPVGFSGGVMDEFRYEEVVFITGKPIKFVGTVKVSEKNKSDTSSVTYKMDLVPHEDYKEDYGNTKYKKSVTYDTEYQDHKAIGQSTGKTTVGKYTESLQVEGKSKCLIQKKIQKNYFLLQNMNKKKKK